MDFRVTTDIVVAARSASGRRRAESVLGSLEPVTTQEPAALVVVGEPREPLAPGAVVVAEAHVDRLLVPAIALVALEQGMAPLHGATVETADGAVVIVGPGGTGKTAALLRLVRLGCRVFSPEWVVVNEGAIAKPVPGLLRLRPHHFGPARAAGLLPAGPVLARALIAAAASRAPAPSERVRRALRHRAHVDVSAPDRTDSEPLAIHRLLMLRAEPVDRPIMETTSADEAAEAIAALVRHDLSHLADPALGAPVEVTRVHGALRDLAPRLVRILEAASVATVRLTHDHPRSAPHLGEALEAVVR